MPKTDGTDIAALFRTMDASREARSKRMKAARRAVGYTLAEAAKAAGVEESAYGQAERRGSESIPILEMFMLLHNIDPNFLYFGLATGLPAETREAIVNASASFADNR